MPGRKDPAPGWFARRGPPARPGRHPGRGGRTTAPGLQHPPPVQLL